MAKTHAISYILHNTQICDLLASHLHCHDRLVRIWIFSEDTQMEGTPASSSHLQPSFDANDYLTTPQLYFVSSRYLEYCNTDLLSDGLPPRLNLSRAKVCVKRTIKTK